MNKQQQQVPNQYGVPPKTMLGYGPQDPNRQYQMEQQNQRQFVAHQNGQYNGPHIDRQYPHDGVIGHRNQNGEDVNSSDAGQHRNEEGFVDNSPPPLNTSTHPLYNKQTTDSRFVKDL